MLQALQAMQSGLNKVGGMRKPLSLFTFKLIKLCEKIYLSFT